MNPGAVSAAAKFLSTREIKPATDASERGALRRAIVKKPIRGIGSFHCHGNQGVPS
jgi:hypothetical protein